MPVCSGKLTSNDQISWKHMKNLICTLCHVSGCTHLVLIGLIISPSVALCSFMSTSVEDGLINLCIQGPNLFYAGRPTSVNSVWQNNAFRLRNPRAWSCIAESYSTCQWWALYVQEGQRELRDMTAASLDRLLEGHSALQLQQGALKEGQEQLDASISVNLQRLAQEKALISTGQQLVAQLIQGITQRIGVSYGLSVFIKILFFACFVLKYYTFVGYFLDVFLSF